MEKFWDSINQHYPELIPFIIDYSTEEVIFQYYKEDHALMAPLFAYPPKLPISASNLTVDYKENELGEQESTGYMTITVTIE